MVSYDRPVYQEEHAAQLIMARRRRSPHKGRIHLRRSVDRPFAFPLQSNGGPYIYENYDSKFGSSVNDGWNTDVIQCALDILILKALSLRPLHGFWIAQRVEQISVVCSR